MGSIRERALLGEGTGSGQAVFRAFNEQPCDRGDGVLVFGDGRGNEWCHTCTVPGRNLRGERDNSRECTHCPQHVQ